MCSHVLKIDSLTQLTSQLTSQKLACQYSGQYHCIFELWAWDLKSRRRNIKRVCSIGLHGKNWIPWNYFIWKRIMENKNIGGRKFLDSLDQKWTNWFLGIKQHKDGKYRILVVWLKKKCNQTHPLVAFEWFAWKRFEFLGTILHIKIIHRKQKFREGGIGIRWKMRKLS